ncbi:hypothetical protein C8R45DRAFT_971743 [Mycena sanguinolenta]|nr:hypothetical protein C8R45DRAFT_971743 [Mycena sanguinolenta]
MAIQYYGLVTSATLGIQYHCISVQVGTPVFFPAFFPRIIFFRRMFFLAGNDSAWGMCTPFLTLVRRRLSSRPRRVQLASGGCGKHGRTRVSSPPSPSPRHANSWRARQRHRRGVTSLSVDRNFCVVPGSRNEWATIVNIREPGRLLFTLHSQRGSRSQSRNRNRNREGTGKAGQSILLARLHYIPSCSLARTPLAQDPFPDGPTPAAAACKHFSDLIRRRNAPPG